MRNDELPLQTVDRALTLLSYLNENEGPHQLRELAAALMMDKAVLHRLLKTLILHSYAVQDVETAAYRIGPRARAIGREHTSNDLFGIARQPMRDLVMQTGFSTFLTLPLTRDAVCVDRAEAKTMLRVWYDVGQRLPYHAGAPGKALLASFAPARRAEALGSRVLDRRTKYTIVARAELDRELARVRRRGFATSIGEVEDYISGVATVIFDSQGGPVGALSISGPTAVLKESLFSELGSHLVRTAAEISRELGAPHYGVSRTTTERQLSC